MESCSEDEFVYKERECTKNCSLKLDAPFSRSDGAEGVCVDKCGDLQAN